MDRRDDPLEQWQREGSESLLGKLLFRLYGYGGTQLRKVIRSLVLRTENGHRFSVTLRRIQLEYYGVYVGMYSGDGAFEPYALPPGTRVGRYCSMTLGLRAFNANHPMNVRSTHAFFYNPALGFVQSDTLTRTTLTIGNDVWIGANAIINSSVTSIGDGAVVGAGAVVHQDVPPYAIVVGNPARVVRYRFSPSMIKELLDEKWWERSAGDLLGDLNAFMRPLEGDTTVLR